VYTPEEATARRAIFESNVANVAAHNAAGKSWTKRINKWADLTGDEWRAQVFSGRRNTLPRTAAAAVPQVSSGALPATLNWTALGGESPSGPMVEETWCPTLLAGTAGRKRRLSRCGCRFRPVLQP
jgi:hypothetical protein